MSNGKTIKERLIRQETKFEDFMITWNKFLTNDFEHLRTRVNWLIGLVITTLITIVVGMGFIILK